mmetsp:Transcript_2713/g.6015  ORF Transcript_2713/g.6015 Transcript_2713/m.6015 type:complete len:218 (-) Transcript_2713:299-952(-)
MSSRPPTDSSFAISSSRRYLDGSDLKMTLLSSSPVAGVTSPLLIPSAVSRSNAFRLLELTSSSPPPEASSVRQSSILALSMSSTPFFLMSLTQSKNCCLMFRVGWTMYPAPFIASRICVTVYGRPELPSTHFSATMLATSLIVLSSCAARSWSDTWTAPLSRIKRHTTSSSLVSKHCLIIFVLANCPLETFVKTRSVCRTSVRSVSVPCLQLTILLR